MSEAIVEETEAKEVTKAEGKLSLYEEVAMHLTSLEGQKESSEEYISELKKELAQAKETWKSLVESISVRVRDLRDIQNGQYQRKLFTMKPDKSGPVDPAFECGVDCLGMSEKENELLEAADIKKVADLEKQMRENEWWHRDIKGFGQAKVDKLTDHYEAWRRRNPVPSEEEDDEDEPNGQPVSDEEVNEQNRQEAKDADEPDNEADESAEPVPMVGSDVEENPFA